MTAYDDALAWLENAMKGPMEPIAAEVWAFDDSFTHVLLVRHRRRGWVPPGVHQASRLSEILLSDFNARMRERRAVVLAGLWIGTRRSVHQPGKPTR